MKSKGKIILLVLCMLGGMNLWAGEAASQGLSLEKARQLALAKSNTIQQALLSVDSSLLAEKAQRYELLPQASLGLSGGISYPAGSASTVADSATVTASFSLSQTIYDGGENAILLAIDRLATESARKEARAAYLDALESTDSAYYAVLEAQAVVEAAESDLSASKAHQAIAQAKFDSGIVIKALMMEAQAETASKETALSQARRTLAVAKAKLKSVTGSTLAPEAVDFSRYDTLMATLMSFDDSSTDAFIAKLQASALANNPALAVSSLALSQAEKEVEAAKTGYLPSVTAGWTHAASYDTAGLDLASKGSLSLSVSVPLDGYVTKNTVQAKTIAARKTALTLDSDIEDLSLSIQSAAYDLISAARSVSSSGKALEYAESNYEVELELFRLSKASSSDLSDAELLVSSNRSSLISARYTFLNGLTSLRNLAGLDSEALLLSLMQ